MAAPNETVSCDELFDLTSDGLDGLDAATLARVEEHAKTCEECRLHLEGVRAADEGEENPETVERTRPEVKARILERVRAESAGKAKVRKGPNYFPLLFIGAAAGVAAFAGYSGTLTALAPPSFTPSPLPQAPPTPGTADSLTTPAQWLAEADRQLGMGRKKEARKWLDKIVADKTAAEEIRDAARKKLDKLGP